MRSSVFMMEEYRMQKAQTEVKSASLTTNGVQPTESDVGQMVIQEDGTARPSNADDNASTRVIASQNLQNEESEPYETGKRRTDDAALLRRRKNRMAYIMPLHVVHEVTRTRGVSRE
ncbi:hypothetical protein JOM56_012811 [Amanita muscaria]